MSKKRYQVRNWSEYNKSLIERGNITLWLEKNNLDKWRYGEKRKPGGKIEYSVIAVKTALLMKEVFRLTYRSCQGFIKSICKLMGREKQKVISFSQLSRRAKEMNKEIKLHHHRGISDVLIDSTGIKIYGEGEWQRNKFHKDKQSDWLKVHLAVDHESQQILSMELSGGRSQDFDHFEAAIDKVSGEIGHIYGDGAYDKWKCYRKAASRSAKLITPPQRTACLQKNNRNHAIEDALSSRDEAILFINSHDDYELGRKKWKEFNNYHKRSLIEATMFRFKSLFGDVVRNKKLSNQYAQLILRCYALNRMTELGMPNSVAIA